MLLENVFLVDKKLRARQTDACMEDCFGYPVDLGGPSQASCLDLEGMEGLCYCCILFSSSRRSEVMFINESL